MAVFVICFGGTFAAIIIGLALDARMEKRGYILRRGKVGFWGEGDR